ncbi:hypothetical protein GCM10028826_27630 [Mucilaginibacter boryungensis]
MLIAWFFVNLSTGLSAALATQTVANKAKPKAIDFKVFIYSIFKMWLLINYTYKMPSQYKTLQQIVQNSDI